MAHRSRLPRGAALPVALAALAFVLSASVQAQGIAVRIMPPNKGQFLPGQTFRHPRRGHRFRHDGDSHGVSTVHLDGKDLTAVGTVDSPSSNVRNWTFRNAELGFVGVRTFTATASGTLAGAPRQRLLDQHRDRAESLRAPQRHPRPRRRPVDLDGRAPSGHVRHRRSTSGPRKRSGARKT